MFNKKLAALAVAGATLLPAASASAVVQLGFILDESGSIGSSNYTIIQNGLASAMSLIPTTGQYEVSVVSFSSGASTTGKTYDRDFILAGGRDERHRTGEAILDNGVVA